MTAPTRERLIQQMREYLERERGIEGDRVTESARLKDDLELDSLDLVEMAMDWEDEYEVRLEDDKVGEIVTVAHAIDYVMTRAAAQAA